MKTSTLATFQRICGAFGDINSPAVDLDRHAEEITRVVIEARAAHPEVIALRERRRTENTQLERRNHA